MDGCLYICDGEGIKVTGLKCLKVKKTLVRTKASKRVRVGVEDTWGSIIAGAILIPWNSIYLHLPSHVERESITARRYL